MSAKRARPFSALENRTASPEKYQLPINLVWSQADPPSD